MRWNKIYRRWSSLWLIPKNSVRLVWIPLVFFEQRALVYTLPRRNLNCNWNFTKCFLFKMIFNRISDLIAVPIVQLESCHHGKLLLTEMKSYHQGHFMVEKEMNLRNSFFSAQRWLLPWFRCQLTNMKTNDCSQKKTFSEWQRMSQCVLVCLHTHLLGSWSAARLHVKSYRLLFISLYSKGYISLKTDLNASDGSEFNF